jgi:putative NIF3 family GTP cyclohydrolase 1 type 2
MIPTPTLRFWGFKEHPFADNILKDDLLDLFVGREFELDQVQDALGRSRVVGVYGNLGVGKSSFLHKLKRKLIEDSVQVAYVHLNADSEQTLFRELLAELLVLQQRDKLPIRKIRKFDPKEEVQRLHASVAKSRGADFGAKLAGLGGNFIEDRTVQVERHTESSARESVRRILGSLKAPLVVIFDDFEKLKYESGGATRDYFPILSRFVSTLEELLNQKYVSFIVSMDEQAENHIQASRKNGGQFAFSLNSLCMIPNLSIEDFWDLIKVRLKVYGWRQKPERFIDEYGFYALAVASANHPRKAVHILAEAMLFDARTETRKKKKIDVEAVREGAKAARLPMDEKDWITVRYLLEKGESSNNDDELREELGYKKSSRQDGYHASVDRKLKAVARSLRLEFEDLPTGQTTKHVLRIPRIIRS